MTYTNRQQLEMTTEYLEQFFFGEDSGISIVDFKIDRSRNIVTFYVTGPGVYVSCPEGQESPVVRLTEPPKQGELKIALNPFKEV